MIELTATVTLPSMGSGTGFLDNLSSLSKHIDISSMHIQTSGSRTKQPRHFTIYLQSCDLRTTSRSIRILLFSSALPVRRICFTAMIVSLDKCNILTTLPLVPLPKSPRCFRSFISVAYCRPLMFSLPVWPTIIFSFLSVSVSEGLAWAGRRSTMPRRVDPGLTGGERERRDDNSDNNKTTIATRQFVLAP